MAIKREKQPRYDQDDAELAVSGVLGLYAEYESRLADRLDPDHGDEGALLLEYFVQARKGQKVNVQLQKEKTEEIAEIKTEIEFLAGGIHKSARRALGDDRKFLAAIGAGVFPAKNYSMKHAYSACELIAEAWKHHRSACEEARIRQRDVDAIQDLYLRLLAADTDQENRKRNRAAGTEAKNSLHRKLITWLDELMAAVEIEFAREPAVIARFWSALPSKKKKSARPAKKVA